MYILVVSVQIDPSQVAVLHDGVRNDVVPRVAKLPGFSAGYWTAGEDVGVLTSYVHFDAKENAENAANVLRNSPRPSSVTITTVEVREVIAQA